MVRTLTSSATGSKDTALGTVPITLIKVEWSSGTVYYADQKVILTGINASATILDFSPIASQETANSVGEVSSASILLDDTSGSLKTIVNNLLIENTPVTVYQHFDGNLDTDLTVLLKGRIISEVSWSEGERTLAFEVETFIENNEVGYAPDDDDIENINPNAIDKPWPLGFGTVLKVPAVRVRRQPTGKLTKGANYAFGTLDVDGGSTFPQDTPVTIKAGGILFTGSFSSNTFTITGSNIAHHTNLSLASRPIDDPNYLDSNVAWLATDEYVEGLYCYVDHPTYGIMVNSVSIQEGRKCFFIKPWRPNGTTLKIILSSSDVLLETATYPRQSWGVPFYHESITSYGQGVVATGHYRAPEVTGGVFISGKSWSVLTGAPVRLQATYDDLYVFNLLPSLEVLEVYGYRTLDSEKELVPIPSSYYTKYLSNVLGPKTCSYLTMAIPLEDREQEGWDGSIYVSYRSTVGPNGTDVLSHLLTNYTNITPDTTTFNTVRPKITSYWANFVVFDQPKALALIEQVSWQLRCAMMLRNGSAYLKYLSEVPTTDASILEANALLKSLSLTFTATEDLATKLVASWRTDYSPEEDAEHTYIYKNNIDTFGLTELDLPITIYNNAELVQKTVDFWGYRYSNVWRLASLNTVLNYMELETFDTVDVTVDALSTNSLRGVLDRVTYNTDSNVINLSMTLASKSGDSDSGQPIEDLYYWAGDPDNPVVNNPGATDPGTGRSEVDYTVPTNGQTNSNPSSDTSVANDPAAEEQDNYFLVFTGYPEQIQRGTNFSLTLQIQTFDGQLVQKDLSATVSITSSDASDSFNKSNIELANGEWATTTAQITGGTGSDTVSFNPGAAGYTSVPLTGVPIINAKTATLSWDTEPASATRQATFSVALSGASADEILNISLNSTDNNDKLYDASGLITTITCDGSGNYSASDWYIEGGFGIDNASLVAGSDDFADEPTTQFPVTGSSPLVVQHYLGFTQANTLNPGNLVITAPVTVADGDPFELTITAYDSNGSVDTTWNNTARLITLDVNEVGVNWADVGPDASILNNTAIVNMVSGVWTYASCQLTYGLTTEGPLELLAETPYPIATRSDSVAMAAGHDYFEYTEAPVGVERDVNFTLTVQIFDTNGIPVTTLSPSATLSLAGTTGSEALNKTTISSGEWSSGVWTNTTMQISGGTASISDVEIIITDDAGNVLEASTVLAIYETETTINRNNDHSVMVGNTSIKEGDPGGDWDTVMALTYAELLTDTPATGTTSGAIISLLSMNYNIPMYLADHYYYSSMTARVTRFTVSESIKSATKVGASFAVDVRGTYYTGVGHAAASVTTASLYVSETEPTDYADALVIGTLVGSVVCSGLNYTAQEVSIPTSVIDNMTGNTLYAWVDFSDDWYLSRYNTPPVLDAVAAGFIYKQLVVLT